MANDKKQSGEKTVVSALLWKFLERFGVQGAQFVLQIILARLLDPDHYGVLSVMVIFTTLANVFVQHGFNTALIQNKNVTEEDYSSVLWVTLGVVTVVYGVLYAAAPFISAFYRMPNLLHPFRVLCLMLFPGALNSIQLAIISREMDFKKVFRSNVAAILISGIIGVALAYVGAGIWALVAQHLTNACVSCIVMWVTVKWRPRLVLNFTRIRVLFSYGWKLLVSGLIDTLYQDLRSLVIGKKYDSGTLGFYNRGKQFPQFIINAVNGTVRSVMLPAMSAQQDAKDSVKSMMRNSIMLSAYIIFPMMAGLAGVAEPVVELLLTEKWLPCVPFLRAYCFTLAFTPVHSCNLQAINAVGRSDWFLKLEIIKKTYGIAILAIAVIFFDSPLAIAMTGTVTSWISWFVNAYPNKKLIGYAYKEQVVDILPSMIMSLVMCGCVLLVGAIEMNIVLKIITQVTTGVVVYLALSALVKPKPFLLLSYKIKESFVNKK